MSDPLNPNVTCECGFKGRLSDPCPRPPSQAACSRPLSFRPQVPAAPTPRGHCWYCSAPINYQDARKILVAPRSGTYTRGAEAAVCSSTGCRNYAETMDRLHGAPAELPQASVPPSYAAGWDDAVTKVIGLVEKWRFHRGGDDPPYHIGVGEHYLRDLRNLIRVQSK